MNHFCGFYRTCLGLYHFLFFQDGSVYDHDSCWSETGVSRFCILVLFDIYTIFGREIASLIDIMSTFVVKDKSFLFIDISLRGIFSSAVDVVVMADKAAAAIDAVAIFSVECIVLMMTFYGDGYLLASCWQDSWPWIL